MKWNIIQTAAAFWLACVSTVSAAMPTNIVSFKPFMGISYGPFRGSESPNYNSYPTVAEITQDLTNSIVFLASEISTYAMDNTLSNIPALCANFNIRCYPCAYVSSAYLQDTTNQLNALIAVGNQNFATTRGLVVGSESILRGYNPAMLVSNINYVRAATHTNVPVGTRDIPASFLNNPSLVAACDFIQADIYAYWAQIPVTNAAAWTIQQWQALTNTFPGMRVEIGEANWPAGGTNNQWNNPAIVPGVANQGRFLSDFVAMAGSNRIEYFIFELRDEPWKTQEGVGTVETNWGILDAAGNKKQSLVNFLSTNFTVKVLSAKTNALSVSIQTYEGNPYTLLEATNLSAGFGTVDTNFTASTETNQTRLTVTGISKTGFFRAQQKF
jgi:exo-beta-1,3-glucanase (GH17 family)